MPPKIALLLCSIFVFILIRLERDHAYDASSALWIPTIWMLYAASKPLAVWFGGLYAGTGGSLIDRIFLITLLSLGLLVLKRREFSWSATVKEHTCLLLLIGYMLISVLWSDIPFISFKRWTREFIALVMAFILLTEPSPQKAFETILRRTAYILIPFSILLIKYFPEYGIEYHRWTDTKMWVGVATQKNGLGRLCLISIFFLLWSLGKKWKQRDISVSKYQNHADLIVIIISLYLMSGGLSHAYSATALGTIIIGLTTLIGLSRMKKTRIYLGAKILSLITIFVFCFGMTTVFLGGTNIANYSSTLGRDTTLTGRVQVWAKLLPTAMRKPILGHGFGGFWTDETRKVYDINQGHSGYLDMLLDLGFVGLFIFLLFLLSCCWNAQRALSDDYSWGSLWICFLFMALVFNITETTFNTFESQMTAILLFFATTSKMSTNKNMNHNRKLHLTKQNI